MPLSSGPDATREFASKLDDPQRWVIKQGVPIFKAHERTDPATGQLIKVDLPKLYRIAGNMQKLERQGGVPIRCTLGHTEPNKSEPEQPPVGGYYKNARVQPFGPKGEPAIVVDEWLDPQYAPVRKNFPYRSAEYYDDAEQITGVALLTRDPFLDLGVVAYERGDSLVCYTAQSQPDRRLNYHRDGRRAPVLYHLVIGEVPPVNYAMSDSSVFAVGNASENRKQGAGGPHPGGAYPGELMYGNWQGAARGAMYGPRETMTTVHQEATGVPRMLGQEPPRRAGDIRGYPLPREVGRPDIALNKPYVDRFGEDPPTPTHAARYGNWQGAARGAVEGGITGARMGAGKGPYGAAVGGVAGAAAGGYHGWHQDPTQNARFAARYAEENGDDIDEDQYSPEDRARMHAEQAKHSKERQRQQSQQDADREAREGRRDRRKPPPFSTYANQGPNMANAQYSAPWPGPAHHRANIGHQHASAWRFADDQQAARYGSGMGALTGAAAGATLGSFVPGVGTLAGGLAGAAGGALMSSQYANSGYGRRCPGRYAEEGPGGPPPGGPGDMGGGPPGGGDPLQQLQMLLMGAVEILGRMTGGGGGGMGPGGPPPGAGGPPPGPPQGPFPGEEEQYARYAAQQGPRRAPQRPAGYGRQPGRYAGDGAPVPYGYPAPQVQPAPRTISGKPVGESMAVSQLNYQLQQQGQVIKMLAYERDQADSEACIEAIQRLADQGYPVSEYEVGELKSKSRDQRGAYLNHIATHYQKIGTENMPQVLGDPTPAGPDPRLGAPTSKEEMEAALKIAANSPNDPTAYNKALAQVRYGRENPAQYGTNRIAGYPQGAADAQPQQEWQPGQQPGFNPGNPYGEPSTNGRY